MKTQNILFSLFAICLSFAIAASAATPPLTPPLFGWQVWPASGERIVPTSIPPETATNATVKIVTARGVVASASFAIRSMAPFKSLSLEPSELISTDGATIPAGQLDLRVVKCWYQDPSGWFSNRRGPGEAVLVPELLLHDDTLVLTDAKTRENLVRTTPAGAAPAYHRIKAGDNGAVTPATAFTAADDAKTLQPLAIAKKETRQFYLTLEIPATTKPGLYHGKLALSADGRQLGHLGLSVRVVDHLLPAPTSRFFGRKFLDGKKVITGTSPAVVSTEQEPFHFVVALPPAYHSPSAVSVLTSIGITDPVVTPSDLTNLKAIFGTTPPKSLWIAAPGALDMEAKGAPAPEGLEKVSKIALQTGVKDVRIYVPSRLSGEGFEKDKKALETIDATGAKAWVFADDNTYGAGAPMIRCPMRRGYPRPFERVGYRIHGAGQSCDPYGNVEHSDTRQCERWRAIGVPYYLYSTLPVGVEDPSVWRRQLGVECYLLGYSGVVLSGLIEPSDPWNDWTTVDHRSRTMIYPTKSGFVSTLAWEGVRDAIIDVRYLSSVRQLADAVRYAGMDFARLDLEGRKASSWLDLIQTNKANLDTVRLDAIAWIDRLQLMLSKYGR